MQDGTELFLARKFYLHLPVPILQGANIVASGAWWWSRSKRAVARISKGEFMRWGKYLLFFFVFWMEIYGGKYIHNWILACISSSFVGDHVSP
jgi:hypothetical protein